MIKKFALMTLLILTVAFILVPLTVRAENNDENIFKEAEKYTVRIYGSTVTALETSSRGSWTGSGFVVHIDRETNTAYVATNKHVVGDGISSLQISFKDGERFPAKPVYIDPIYDFGVIKFDMTEHGVPQVIEPAKLGSSANVEVGLTVGTFGNPVGLEYSATKGIVSSITNSPSSFAGSFLQTDAAINPGNSGGPLISMEDGTIIGVNTAVTNNTEGIGWSLAIDQLKPILEQVIKGELPYAGRMGWLGATISEINVDRAKEDFGAAYSEKIPRKAILITSILIKSPAEAAGLQPGDVIISIDNTVPQDEADFFWVMRTFAGQKCDFIICRLGEEITLEVEVMDRGAMRPAEYITFAGMVIQANTPTVYEKSYSWASPDCVYVCDILEGSSANTWGARKGPIRGLMVNMKYYPVASLDDFWNAIKDVPPGQAIELFYWTANYGSITKVVYYSPTEAPKREKVEL